MIHLVHLLLAAALLFTGIPTARAEDRALIVGVNAYPNLPTKQLTGAVNDARAMAKLAVDTWGFKPEQIKLLLDADATSTSILAEIESWLVDGTDRGDRVLFYYAGHGYHTYERGLPPEDAWRETIAPYDVRVSADRRTFDNMIVDLEIRQRLDTLKDRTVMFIADSCHSGTLWRNLTDAVRPGFVRSLAHDNAPSQVFRSMRAAQFDARRARRAETRPANHLIAWSAVQPTELAEEDMDLSPTERQGVFTRRFIEGLRDKRADRNGDGAISVMELYRYVSEQTGVYCGKHPCRSGRMTPMMEAPGRFIGLDLLAWRPPGAPKQPNTPPPAAVPTNVPKVTNLLPAGNDVGLKLDLLPAPTARVGQETKVRLTSPRTGWLILLDVRDNGRVVQLFPSTCAIPDRQVRAGATITVPDARYGCAFTASEPGGGEIVAIISEDNVPVDGLLARNRDLSVVPDADAYLAELAQRLMQAWHGEENTRPTRWSLVRARYTVSL